MTTFRTILSLSVWLESETKQDVDSRAMNNILWDHVTGRLPTEACRSHLLAALGLDGSDSVVRSVALTEGWAPHTEPLKRH